MLSAAFVIFLQVLYYATASYWNYKHQDTWSDSCQGKMQSPVDITDDQAVIKEYSPELHFNYYYREQYEATITNIGTTVVVNILNNSSLPEVYDGGFDNEYVLEAFHFHWNSEHVINGYRYPLEGHFVHYAKNYDNFTNALNFVDGVAVLAVFYDVTEDPNPVFDNLINTVPRIAHEVNQPVKLENPIIVADFLPSNLEEFYRYRGSLTTPNCTEVVAWTLFTTPSGISEFQLKHLTHIWTAENELLENNFRQLQNINHRNVFLNLG